MSDAYELKVAKATKQNGVRKFMGKAMLSNWNSIPHFVQMANARADNLVALKKELDVSYNDIIIKAVANAVKAVPEVNSALQGDEVLQYEDINVSVAVVNDIGLFVPVIRNADQMSVEEISQKVRELADKASKGMLYPDEMAFGTITVSNLGFSEVETGTPIINAPQGALVFMGKIRKEPVVMEEDQIAVGHIIGFSVGYDHRFLDGMTAQRFTSRLKKEIETISKEKVL